MTSFYNYNRERSEASSLPIYVMAIFAGAALVFILIALGYGIQFFIALVIKYYLWVLGVLAVIGILTYFWNKRKRRSEICEYH